MKKLQNNMKSTIMLATVASSTNSDDQMDDATSSHQGKRQPYIIKLWRVLFEQEEKEVNGTKWHWCKGIHYCG